LPIRQEHVSGLFWIVLAVVFCQLPGSWSMPLNILLEIVTVVLVITIVFSSLKRITIPAVTQLPVTCEPGLAPEPRDELETQVQQLEFRYVGDFDVTSIRQVSSRVRAYVSRDLFFAAILVDMTTTEGKTTVLEFVSELNPAGGITTNNFSLPSVYSRRPGNMRASVPWKTTAKDVFALHMALCQVARDEKLGLQSIYVTGFAERLRDDMRKENEYQVEMGRLRRAGKDKYRMTLRGAIIAAPLVWYCRAYGGLFSWYKVPDAYYCAKFRSRLRHDKRAKEEPRQPESE
jgi:hypothetical protein